MTLKQLFRHLRPYVRPYRWLVVSTLLLTVIGSFIAQVNAWVIRYTVDSVGGLLSDNKGIRDGGKILLLISVILIGNEIIGIFTRFGQNYFGDKLRIYMARDLAQGIISKILTYRLEFFTTNDNSSGKLQTRIDRGVESLTRMVQNFFIDLLPLFASSIIALIIMFHASAYIGLVCILIVPIYFEITRRQGARLRGSRQLIRSLREKKSQGILSIIDSMPVIKSFNRQDIEEKKQMGLQMGLTNTQMKIRRTGFFYTGARSFIEQIGLVAVIILSTYFVLKGTMTIGSIAFHVMLYHNVTSPIRQLHMTYDQMNDALIYAEGFFAILQDDAQIEGSGQHKTGQIRGMFKVNDITFTYPENKHPTLYNITMEIRPGRTTALVGLSGAGKSTLINLLEKFYQPDSGEILLDGIPLNNYDTDFLRANIGLVLQKNHIFNGTIAQNILYGDPSASIEQVIEASKKAYLHDQITALPKAYETSALALSGGQQQRIAIARIFLKNPPVIFLDEPTASLDAVATEQIKSSMDAIKKDRTVIIISHSISQIIDADHIYVMKNGHMLEHGEHDSLYSQAGEYRQIFDAMARSLNISKIATTLDAIP